MRTPAPPSSRAAPPKDPRCRGRALRRAMQRLLLAERGEAGGRVATPRRPRCVHGGELRRCRGEARQVPGAPRRRLAIALRDEVLWASSVFPRLLSTMILKPLVHAVQVLQTRRRIICKLEVHHEVTNLAVEAIAPLCPLRNTSDLSLWLLQGGDDCGVEGLALQCDSHRAILYPTAGAIDDFHSAPPQALALEMLHRLVPLVLWNPKRSEPLRLLP
mmetsp:Transcript_19175/g.55651  ORF Transcript_19175/g.55651 Transcript_19175/m.55651 type:complete len:217 (-) Transcript_19175:161-811(-)